MVRHMWCVGERESSKSSEESGVDSKNTGFRPTRVLNQKSSRDDLKLEKVPLFEHVVGHKYKDSKV